ncbi:MAG: hypothetical protein IJQ31_06795 [Thermoguttaceae bacterium]|nr:hypothetical protein [Thermoguttaceae bacterium]
MKTRIAEGTHSRLDSIATAVNSAIRQMEGMPSIDVAIIGYHRDADGNPVIGSRWSGPFAGKIWVSSDELVANPVRIETRAKHMVNPVTRAVTQMTVEFPVWFDLIPGAGRLQYTPVYEYLAQILTDWINQTEPAIPPLIFSFLSDLQPNDSISNAVIPLGKVSTPQGFPMLLQFHVGAYTNVPAIKYPTVAQFLPYGAVQELFYACSPLTDFMFTALRQNQEFPAAGAKALVYNGRMIDIVRMLGCVKVYQSIRPARAAGAKFKPQDPELQVSDPESNPQIPDFKPQAQNFKPQNPPAFATPPQEFKPQNPPTFATPPQEFKPQNSPAFAAPPQTFKPQNPPTFAVPPLEFNPQNFPTLATPPKDFNPQNPPAFDVPPQEFKPLDSEMTPPNAEVPNSSPIPNITPCPPIQSKTNNVIQMPGLLSASNSSDALFADFDHESDEDDSLADIPSVGNLPEVKAEIIPDGFEYRCQPFPTNKSVPEPPNLPPRQALVILMMDRSVSSLTYKPALETWAKRMDKIRFMLGEFARRGRGRYDVGIVSYGKERDGRMTAYRNSLGRTFLPDNCLTETAGKVELTMIQIPNGIGGLISLPRKKLFFTDCTPTYSGDPVTGIRSAIEIIREWEQTRQNKVLSPVIVHLTSGQFRTERLDEALNLLADPTLPQVQFLQWVFTERPHIGVCCPTDTSFTQDETLQMLWERTDPLPAREFLAGVRPGIHEESRGMMVNMDFDVLFEALDMLARKKNENP